MTTRVAETFRIHVRSFLDTTFANARSFPSYGDVLTSPV